MFYCYPEDPIKYKNRRNALVIIIKKKKRFKIGLIMKSNVRQNEKFFLMTTVN